MENVCVNLSNLDGDTNVIIKQSALHRFGADLLECAIDKVRAEIGLHPKDVYYTIKQVSEMLSVDRTTLHRWNKMGYLTPVKFGGLVRYRKADIEALIAREEA